MSDTMRFLREFVRDPLHTAALAPSSPGLATAMAAAVPLHGNPTVIELGPGPGALTAAVQERLGTRGRHVAVERHERWATLLQERFPRVEVVHADVADLAAVLADRDVAAADAIVSGLPWAAYDQHLPATMSRALAPSGCLTQFAYAWARRWAPPARAELAMLRAHFALVRIGPTIWCNLPPAVVYYAGRPLHDDGWT